MTQEINENFGIGTAVDFTSNIGAEPIQYNIPADPVQVAPQSIEVPDISAPVENVPVVCADSVFVFVKSTEPVSTSPSSCEFLLDVYLQVSNTNTGCSGVVKKRLAFDKMKLLADCEAANFAIPVAVIEAVKMNKAGWYVVDADGKAVAGPYNETECKRIAKHKDMKTTCVTPSDVKRKVAESMSPEEKAAKEAQRARELAGIPHPKNWT